MANQSTSKDITLTSSELSDDNLTNTSEEVVKWTTKLERCLLFNMINLKPCGVNKHMNVLIIRDRINKELKINISTYSIWKYLESKWDLEAADVLENSTFDTNTKDFVLPPEFDKLTLEERENILKEKENKKEKEQKCLNRKRKLSSSQEKTISKANLLSSVQFKDDENDKHNQITTISENTLAKINEVSHEEVNIRRSLRSVDKSDEKEQEIDLPNKKKSLRTNNKSDEINKIIDSKQSNKKSLNNSDLEKNEKPMAIRVQKRKCRNESESSISSDNSKRISRCRTLVSELTVSDRSSRSITPEILRGRTLCRSVTPETISRKSNLRSNDKDQKSKFNLEKSNKPSHNADPVLSEKSDKQSSRNMSLTESKSKHSIQNKNDLNKKNKGKVRGRITSDLLVAQQNSDCQPLGKRSCSNKST